MKYDHNIQQHRRNLAQVILSAMHMNGMTAKESPNCREAVFVKTMDNGIEMLVYTSIENGEVRQVGEDAIRVTAVYNGRGLVSTTRVHRVGEVNAIVDRIANSMSKVWKSAAEAVRCHNCGAPKFTSKKGNLVCADLCWTR
jgi:hypothetical protein